MCGLCNESQVIEILDADGDLSAYSGFPLLEGESLRDELRGRAQPLAGADNALVLCRLLELLAVEGFAAPVCRQLREEPLVVRAIEAQCAGEQQQRLKGLPFSAHRDEIALLYDPATYLTAAGWARLRSEQGHLGAAGEEVLAWFVERFIRPNPFEPQDPEELPDELDAHLWLLARLIMAGIAGQGDHPHRRLLVEKLLLGHPRFGSKTFIGLDLWLQRRAFLHHARRQPEWVQSYRFPARPMLYAYFAVKTRMAMVRRQALAAQIEGELRQQGQLYAEDLWAITLLQGNEQELSSFPTFKEAT